MTSSLKRAGIGALVAAAGIAATSSTAEAASCTFSPTNARELRVQMLTNEIIVQNNHGTIVIGEPGTSGFACTSRASIDRLVIRSANGPGHDRVTIDESLGKFGGLKISAQTGSGGDDIVVNGSPGEDTYTATLGLGASIAMDGTQTNLTSTQAGSITFNGNGGHDTLDGATFGLNGPGGDASLIPLRMNGGAGPDTIIAGRSGRDILDGGTENDFIRTDQRLAGDKAFGGLGADTIIGEPGDTASGFENGGIGAAKPGALRAHAGRTETIKLAWAHPTAWKKLKTLTLTAEDHGEPVGSITLDRATGRATDRGALRFAGHTPFTHKGKRIATTLQLKVAPKYAGRKLELRMLPKG